MSGNFSYFRHSVNMRNDPKMVHFQALLGRRKKEAYNYYCKLLELCASEAENGQVEFTFHQKTLRDLWELTQQGLHEVCTAVHSSLLLECILVESSCICRIENLTNYLGSYSLKEKKEKEKKENIIIKPSPLSFLFDKWPEIQEWLNNGNHDTHALILKSHSHHEIVDLVEKAFNWAKPKNQRAETWLYTFVANKNTHGYGANKAQVKRSGGNPYLAEHAEKFGDKAGA